MPNADIPNATLDPSGSCTTTPAPEVSPEIDPIASIGPIGPIGPRQRTALISWAAFAVTFGAARGLTYAIKKGAGPFGDAQWGGVHLHHYLWGIKLLAASGGVAIHGADRFRDNPLVAVGYGAGAALVIDESAMLVHFKDVYWSKSGRVSMLVGSGLIGAVGASFFFIPAWQRRRRPPEPTTHLPLPAKGQRVAAGGC